MPWWLGLPSSKTPWGSAITCNPNSREHFYVFCLRDITGICHTNLCSPLQCLFTNCYPVLPQSTLFLMAYLSGTYIPLQALQVRTNLVCSVKVKIKPVGCTIGIRSYAKWDCKMHCQLSMWHSLSLPSSAFRSSLPAHGSYSPLNAGWTPGVILLERIMYMAYDLLGYTLSSLRNHGVQVPFQSSSWPHCFY